jgi:hypothetical protein
MKSARQHGGGARDPGSNPDATVWMSVLHGPMGKAKAMRPLDLRLQRPNHGHLFSFLILLLFLIVIIGLGIHCDFSKVLKMHHS